MKIKFLADEDLRRSIVLGVRRREPAINFLDAIAGGASGRDDAGVLQIAANEGRVLISHDFRTLPKHFRHFVTRQASPGVFLIPQRLTVSTAIEELLILWVASEAEEWVNRLCYLPL